MSSDLGLKPKDTIYIDVDDEITGIIEKVSASNGKVVALVLPKRSAVMQSVVNMKLLKRTAENAKRNLVLVTNEAGLLPLAGMVGLHVAATPTSKPAIPPAPHVPDDDEDSIEEALEQPASDESLDIDAAADMPVGTLADRAAPASALLAADTEEPAAEAAPRTNKPSAAAPLAPAAGKKIAVPNFQSFRKRLVLAGLAGVLLAGGLIAAVVVMPKAVIHIQTDSSEIATDLALSLSTEAKTLNPEKNIVPAVAQTSQKTFTQSAAATGQQNNGEKAAGKMTIVNCADDDVTLPAGTSFSSGGHTFVSTQSVTVPVSNFSSPFTGSKCKNDGKASVEVLALKPGAEYNIAAGAATISGGRTGLSAAASQMTGGTDVLVKVVTQSDIDGAKAKIAEKDAAALKQDLAAALKGKGYLPLDTTFVSGEQQVTASAAAGEKADSVSVTSTVPYTMLGVKEADVRTLVVTQVRKKIDTKKQKILSDGVAKAKYTQQTPGSPTAATVTLKTKSIAGPQLDQAAIKQQALGKKAADVEAALKNIPGVTNVEVKYSPFWVTRVPKSVEKITVQVDK